MTEKEKKKMGRPLIADKPLKSITVRLSDEEIQRIEKMAQKKDKTRAAMVRELILSAIKD